MDINKCSVVEKVFRKDRFFAVLDHAFRGRKTMPYAHYIWLKGNPSFMSVPKGYVVHHLDWDKTNDDISNLALMQNHHHIAHHWKQQKIQTEVVTQDPATQLPGRVYFPTLKPRCHYDKKSARWYVSVTEKIKGKRTVTRLFRFHNKKMETKEQAQELIAEIWTEAKQQWAGKE